MISYGLDSQVQFLATAVTSFKYCVFSSPAGYPASYRVGTEGSFRGVKWPDHEAGYPPPVSVSVVNVYSNTSVSLCIFLYVVLI